ncbi:hypothetical protein [Serratia bockelmannii]|uniref:Uncharacterized protein n=1 Tax=Serratia bockelmannii TaxID=2703793 RepID=A0ABT8LIN0_9GAMM|nr:hypothetical protein [Serratia bockelmannii]MDN6877125.1 hypothetical protein [Serratia bockelmannii]
MFGFQANNHAMVMERLQRGCSASGAPDFMWDFLKALSVKTGFNIRTGTPAMIQPFISGKLSWDDVLSISNATGYILNMKGVSTLDQYKDAISLLYERLK